MTRSARRLLNRRAVIALGGSALALALLPHGLPAADLPAALSTDVCVYGGTASGVAAAIAAHDEGVTVVVVEPSRWLGGMSGGGTTAPSMDWGNKSAAGGLALKLLLDGDDPGMRAQNLAELTKRSIPVLFEHRLSAVVRDQGRIRTITLDFAPPDTFGVPAAHATTTGARTITANVFIDCSYEGDLLAQSGASYTYGRESRETYGESLGGMLPMILTYPIDPYMKPGDPRSGLIPLMNDLRPGEPGSADKLTQKYCFRLKLCTEADRIPITKPDSYDPRLFEIWRRGFQGKVDMALGMQRKQVDVRQPERNGLGPFHENASRSLWSQSVAGVNTTYPEGDWAERSRIWRFHIDFIRGMYHFLRTDPAVPQALRERADRIGLRPGRYDDTAGWPNQLYVREARRMTGVYVMTQKDVEGSAAIDDPVGLASYGIDDWPYAMVPHQGGIGIITGEFMNCRLTTANHGIYRIPYRSIVPKQAECSNLLVPVCLSASHVAMLSLRMEPVYVILGQSAGIAAALAVKAQVPVQQVDYATLKTRLLAGGQKLT
jgi:FAD dependent oxidoreductase